MSVTVTSDAGAVERMQGAGPARKIMGPLTKIFPGPPYQAWGQAPKGLSPLDLSPFLRGLKSGLKSSFNKRA